jgi:site-specific DNA-methyltransferase (adenine-specific)/modification methylase
MFDKVEIGNATLYHGDCLEILPRLEGVDAVITDPPYGINYRHDYARRKMPNGSWMKRTSMPAVYGDDHEFDPTPLLDFSLVLLWGANHYAHRLPHNGKWLIWDKRCQIVPPRNQADCEIAWLSKYGSARIFYHLWDGMVKDSERGETRVHPTQKPVAVMKWCIEQAGMPETILDPFMGSGTTGVACMQLGRKFIGIEIERKYFDISCKRIEEAQRQLCLYS